MTGIEFLPDDLLTIGQWAAAEERAAAEAENRAREVGETGYTHAARRARARRIHRTCRAIKEERGSERAEWECRRQAAREERGGRAARDR